MKSLVGPLLSLVLVFVALVLSSPSALARDDDERSFDQAILDILLERGLIDEAAYQELLALASARRGEQREVDLLADQLQRLKAPEVATQGGKAGKLEWASDDGKWSLGLKGRLQVQADVVDGETGNEAADSRNLSVRRARLGFQGKAGTEGLTYKLEIDAGTQNVPDSATKAFSVQDAFLNWDLGESADLRAGQFKFPFGREVHMVSTNLNLVEESIASREFSPSREPGVMVYGASPESVVEWFGAVSNGEGSGQSNKSANVGVTGSDGLRTGVRVVVNPFGKLPNEMSAFSTAQDGGAKLAFGASYMINSGKQADGPDAGAVPGGPTDPRTTDDTLGLEMQAMLGPVSILAEQYQRTKDYELGLADEDDDGMTLQAGVFVVPETVELVLRRSTLDLDLRDDLVDTSLGVVYYVDRYNSRLAVDLSDVENEDTANRDFKRLRAQYQVVF